MKFRDAQNPDEEFFQDELEMPLSLRDKLDLETEVDFFAIANQEEFEKPVSGLKALPWPPCEEDEKDHRKRFRSEDYSYGPNYSGAGFHQNSEKRNWQKPKVLNYICEVRRLLKTEEQRETIMTITTEDSKTYTAKKTEKSKTNVAETQQFTIFSNPNFNFKDSEPEFFQKREPKLDTSVSELNDSKENEDKEGLSNIKEDSREYEGRSERKASLVDSGIDPSVVENCIYSRPYVLSQGHSEVIEHLDISQPLNMPKKSEKNKSHLNANRGSSLPKKSPEQFLETSNTVIQKIENILNRRQQKNEKLLQKISQPPKLKYTPELTKPRESVKGATISLSQVDQEQSKVKPPNKISAQKRSGSATILSLNGSLYGGLPKEGIQTFEAEKKDKKHKAPDSTSYTKSRLSINLSKLSMKSSVTGASPNVGKEKKPNRNQPTYSINSKTSMTDPFCDTLFKRKPATMTSLSKVNIEDEKNVSNSVIKGCEKTFSRRKELKTSKRNTARTSKHSDSAMNKIDISSLVSPISRLTEALVSETPRTVGSKLKPKRLVELKEETQLIISRLMNKKKGTMLTAGDKESISVKASSFADDIKVPEFEKEMSTSLFSANLLMMSNPPRRENSSGYGRNTPHSMASLSKTMIKSKDLEGKKQETQIDKTKNCNPNSVFSFPKYFGSPLKSTREELLSPLSKLKSKPRSTVNGVGFSTPQSKIAMPRCLFEVSTNNLKKTSEPLRKIIESPSLSKKNNPINLDRIQSDYVPLEVKVSTALPNSKK